MKTLLWNIWKVGRWIVAAFVVLFIGLVLYRIPAVIEEDKTAEAVKYIQEQKITLADVTGERLPPRPDQTLADATIEGIDANKNGIRDDVERAIFDRYPGDTNIKIRAAMLQYAIGLQLQLTKVFNSETWKAAVQQSGRGYGCIYDNISGGISVVLEKTNEIENLIRNTEGRIDQYNNLDKFRASFSVSDRESCDLD